MKNRIRVPPRFHGHALTTFIVFPCSIERNVTLPPAPLGHPSSFDSGFSLFPFFFRLFLCASPERIVKHASRPRGYRGFYTWHLDAWKKNRARNKEEGGRERERDNAKWKKYTVCPSSAKSLLLLRAGNPNPKSLDCRDCQFRGPAVSGRSCWGEVPVSLALSPRALPFYPASSFLCRATVSDGTVT